MHLNTLVINFCSLIKTTLYYSYGWIRASLCGVRLSAGSRISPYSDIKKAAYLGDVVVGRAVSIGEGTYVNSGIISSGNIGKYCSIAYGVLIGLMEHKPDYWTTSPYEAVALMEPPESTNNSVPPPVICDRVWVGANAVILRGVVIGEGAIVAAGAIVTKDIPPYEIWGGCPAKYIRSRKVTLKIPGMRVP